MTDTQLGDGVSEASADAEPTVVDLADDRAGDLLDALGSTTARHLLERVRESPSHPAELADEVGTSLQNVHYHLDRLEAAGAVEVVDTIYSVKGREMSVYAPAADPLVIFGGETDDVAELLSEVLGAVGLLALLSVAVQEVVERVVYPGSPTVLVDQGGQYASPPMTNGAPPVGLFVFGAGLVALLGWLAWRRHRAQP